MFFFPADHIGDDLDDQKFKEGIGTAVPCR